MSLRRTVGPRALAVWLIVLFIAAAGLMGARPAPVYALNQAQVTLDQSTGDQPIRYTFEANTDASETLDSISLAFPEGFDIKDSKTDVVTLQGLNRVTVPYTSSVAGQVVTVKFEKPVAGGSDLRVTVGNVLTPAKGGTYSLKVTYLSGGQEKTFVSTNAQNTTSFSFATPTLGESIAHRLDQSPLVAKWNSVPFLNLFLQPQYAVIALTTVWQGWLISISLILLAFPLAIVGGLMLAFMKMAKIAPIRWIANVYVNVIRGTPLFLQIAVAFVGLPIAGLRVQWFATGVIVLALNSSAYLAEIFRAGIQSINKGQFEAASSLGMTYPQAMGFVVVPQTVKRVLPTMTSEFILLFKDTALLSAVGVFELMLYSNSLVARSGNITPFMIAACYYLIITIPLINIVAVLEAKLAVSEGGSVASLDEKKKGRSWWRWRPSSAGPESEFLTSTAEHESR
ncbi:MAG: ABC transporter permease subunit [Coriobacteriia bacterium]|nr:ABC transporter permease subunit [Coriobacteriia bacterium]